MTSVKPSRNNIRPNNSLKRKKSNRQSSSDKIFKDPCNTPQPFDDPKGDKLNKSDSSILKIQKTNSSTPLFQESIISDYQDSKVFEKLDTLRSIVRDNLACRSIASELDKVQDNVNLSDLS